MYPDTTMYAPLSSGGKASNDPMSISFAEDSPARTSPTPESEQGITGPKSSLWGAMLDTIRHIRPRYVLVENVSALVVRGLDTVLADLAAIGFDAEWATLRASDFGAPHNRERIYILAYPAGGDRQSWNLLGESGERRPPLAARRLSGLDACERRRQAAAWLERQPDVGRLVDGIPYRMERLTALGNAVVPAVSEHIGKQLAG